MRIFFFCKKHETRLENDSEWIAQISFLLKGDNNLEIENSTFALETDHDVAFMKPAFSRINK